MNYQETLEYLFNSTPVFEHVGAVAYKEGLTTTRLLDEHFGAPHRQYKTIHVAGTNGKGSCSHTLAAVLQAAGYRVGLYTSPHLVDFRERIRVNGQCVSQQYVVDFVERERSFFEPLHPSFFELTTAMAFAYFAEQKVDVAVIEVGLGGRLDCTNIITPVLSVITNIGLDHTQFLGTTLPQIAGEKAGIIKEGVPVVVGEWLPETAEVFSSKAGQKHAKVVFAEDVPLVLRIYTDGEGLKHYSTEKYGTIDGELRGDYQEKNANTILTAIGLLTDFHLSVSAVKEGFAHVCALTGLMGRWQMLQQEPLVVCDTGHNTDGWNYLSKQIARQHGQTKRIVFGMVDDKDIHTVMGMLPRNARYYFTQASTKRAVPVENVVELGRRYGLQGAGFRTVEAAYEAAMADACASDFVFVGGSSYVVADLLSIPSIASSLGENKDK